MRKELKNSAMTLMAMTLITGVAYPLLVTLVAQLVFPAQANGSLIVRGGSVVGSELIGQQFTRPEYFWGRLSATLPVPYNAAASGGSNFGPANPGLAKAAQQRADELLQYDTPKKLIPVDLITSSGSGLDPHISLAAAEFQTPRIAKLRQVPLEKVQELIRRATEGRQFGILGEPRVNVLKLNLSLDEEN